MSSRRLLTHLCVRALLAVTVASSAVAQTAARSSFVPLAIDSTVSVPALATPVSLAVTAEPLGSVVSTIAKQAGLSLTFDASLPGIDRKVSLTLTRIAAGQAILRVLDQSPIQALVSPSGQIVLVARSSTRPAGVIEGTISDANTAMPLPGARVELVGTRFATVSRDRGEFSLGRIPNGAYTMRVTRLGFAPTTVERVTVATNVQLPALDVALAHAPVSLATVVVTPGYFGMMEPTLGAQQAMTRERIETIPQIGEDIYRAVNRLPGVTSNDFSADFSVRGGSGSELYVTLDGLELIEPFHLKDIGGGLSIIDSRAIGGVELTTGGFSAEYGDRLTGVFTMRSRDPKSEGVRTSLGLSVMNARVTSQGEFASGRGAWLASARRGYLDLAIKLANAGDSLDPRYYDLFGKVQYDLGRAGRVAVHVLDAGDEMTYINPPDPRINSRYRSNYLWLRWEGQVGAVRQQTVASLGRLNWRRDGEREGRGTLTALVNDRRTVDAVGVRQDWSIDLGRRALLKFGGDLKQGDATYDYWSIVGTDSLVGGSRTLIWDTTNVESAPRSTRVAAYVAPRVRLFESVAVELGLRYDRSSHTRDEVFSPRFNVSWQPRTGTSVRGAWGMYSQSQPLAALQAQDGVDQFFSAERAEHRVIGVEQALPRGLVGRVEAYDRRLSHQRPLFVSTAPGLKMFPEILWDRVRLDPGRGQARGIEFLLSRDLGQLTDWSLGYALASATDRIEGRDVPRATDQRHTVTGDWSYRPRSNKWRLSIAGVWRSGWPTTPEVVTVDTVANTPNNFEILPYWTPGVFNSERLASYRRVDARWTRFFDTRTGRASLFLEVYNLFDTHNRRGYSTNVNVDGRRRNVSFVQASEIWMPRLPTFGITWEFGGVNR